MPSTERDLVQARRNVDELRRRARTDPDRHLPDLGHWLARLAARLVERPERHEELLDIRGECVGVCRRLAAEDPRQWRPDLALALYQHALALGVLGHRSRALPVAQESVDLLRDLVREEGDAHLPELALALTGLGDQLTELGRSDEGLELVREAVAVRRDLAARRPADADADAEAEAEPELASALVDLGIKLGELERKEEAVAVLGDALGRHRLLDPADPTGLWLALFTLARELTALGRADEARPLFDEAAAQYRELTDAYPDFTNYMAALMRRYNYTITGDGRFAQVDAYTESAIDPAVQGRIRQRSAQGVKLALAGDFGRAVEMARDAVDLCRQALFDGGARTGTMIELARCLHNLGLASAWGGRRTEALAATDEAVRLYRRTLSSAPDVVRPLLADSLDSLGTRLAAAGRQSEALTAAEESVALYRQLADADPATRRPLLARALNNLSIRLTDSDRHHQSLTATQEVVDIYRQLHRADPTRHLDGLIHGLSNLALRLARVGRDDEILTPTTEAVQHLEELPVLDHSSDIGALAESLAWLGHRLAGQGHRREGRRASRMANDLRRRAAAR
ncbi:tetratricopeptide repeat protein [Streptomyces sp. NBC_01304]|uniref:tetratricopeptide repeat protein n=1 Tax=Streptomyces sp. NBC_01304 TaxID=2903818 RepID=UPI002E117C12|nr:tetratricopeptide repeat protein [Streptomyces sp. NBC_01304]